MKNNKYKFGKIFLTAAFFSIVLFLSSCSNSYKIVKYSESVEGFNSVINIPEFKKWPELNECLKNSIFTSKDDFRDNWAVPTWKILRDKKISEGETDEPSALFYNADSTVVCDKKYLSVFVKCFFDVGNIIQKQAFCYVWDKTQNKRVNIQDITGLSLESISEKIKWALEQKFSELPELERKNVYDYIEFATKPEEKKFQYFSVKGRKVTVYYPAGKAAPEAYGQLEAVFEF